MHMNISLPKIHVCKWQMSTANSYHQTFYHVKGLNFTGKTRICVQLKVKEVDGLMPLIHVGYWKLIPCISYGHHKLVFH